MNTVIKHRLVVYTMALLLLPVACTSEKSAKEDPYYFDGSISEEVLRNYLDRSVTMAELCVKPELAVDGQGFCFEDDIRLIKNIRPKFIGRTLFRWGRESDLNDPDFLHYARKVIEEVHAFDSDVVLQAAVFEAVSRDVENVPIPARIFEAFGLPEAERHFDYESMLFSSGLFVDHWGKGSSVPDVNMLESRMWFYYLATKYIETGFEGIHWGQVALMGAEDPDLYHWFEMVGMIREYAKQHARRHFVLHDAHGPWGGFLREGVHMLDFNSFPLRIVPGDEYMEGILPEETHFNSIYRRSLGGETPSGWTCEGLPYIVEFDNFGISKDPGQLTDGPFIWGYDEITWFSLKGEDEQKDWLEYAHNWVRKTDPNGYLQMPVSRVVVNGIEKTHKYKANIKSAACPEGTGLENKIKELWKKQL